MFEIVVYMPWTVYLICIAKMLSKVTFTPFSRVAVAEWLVRPPAKQEVCRSNLSSYLC